MDIQKTVKEIGLFEVAINLTEIKNSEDVIEKVGASMPLPDDDIVDQTKEAARWLCSFQKKKYLFLLPEIALAEEMYQAADQPVDIIFSDACHLDEEARERMKDNLPAASVTTIAEPFFPQDFYPSNAMIVITGCLAAGRAMVLSDVYRLVEHYGAFRGKIVFLPYKTMDAAIRCNDWMELKANRITAMWEVNHE